MNKNETRAIIETEKILFEIAKLDEKKQEHFLHSLENILNKQEIESITIGIAYFRLLLFPELKNAMMEAMGKELYKTFNKE